MIDGQHHVKINGVPYRLAEDAEGEHYARSLEPLRPPNSVMVQGQDRQDLFQVRPDVLLWSLTDWSGGEGQYKYSFSSADRHAIIRNLDPFVRPGTLRPGPPMKVTTNTSGGTDFNAGVVLTVHNQNQLWGWSIFLAGVYYVWSDANESWGAFQSVSGDPIANAPAPDGVVSDGTNVYYLDGTAGTVFKVSGGGVSDQMDNGVDIVPDAANASLRELGDYIYYIRPSAGKVGEMAKSASGTGTWTLLDDLTWGGSANYDDYGNQYQVAVSENRIYYMFATEGGRTEIREVTPTSAAGPGSTASLAVIRGIVGLSLWYHGGLLYMLGWEGELQQSGLTLFYIDPSDGGTYGVVDRILPDVISDGLFLKTGARGFGSEAGADLGRQFFTIFDPTNISAVTRIYQHDPITGGLAQYTGLDRNQADEARACLVWQGDVFEAFSTTSDTLLYRAEEGLYMDSDDAGEGIFFASPWHDFGLADQKILSSISLITEEMPADWQLEVYYALDGDPDYTLAGTFDTDGATGTKFSVSTSADTTLFRTLQVKVLWVYTGASSEITTAPVLLSVDVKAQVAQPQNSWQLLLDLKDDLSASAKHRDGNQKINNLITAGDAATVVEFVDGYQGRRNTTTTTHNVVIDSFRIILGRPGEGYAQVTLRETA